ncbi:MAG: hypothetical protein JW900_09440 [Anaerolineae bacterium]|nr:hypothetical protein [Anaerolineae bacterium]
MSALIRVLLSTETAQLQPGERAETTLTVQNLSETVGRYRIAVEGVPPDWVRLSRRELSLFPNDQDQVRMTVNPPNVPGTQAGRYTLQAHVVSEEDPTERTTVPFLLQVGTEAILAATLQPAQLAAAEKGSFAVQLANAGPVDLNVLLEAVDPAGGCFFSFEPPQVTVPAGRSASAQLTVRPLQPLSGRTPVQHTFTVEAWPAESPRLACQMVGRWEERPRRAARWPFLAAAAVVLIAAAVLFYLFAWPRLQGPRGGGEDGPTSPLVQNTVPPAAAAAEATQPAPTTAVVPATPVEPTAAPPAPSPTPDLEAEIYARLDEYNTVRAQAEVELEPELLRQVCVDPYLTQKMDLVNRNIADGTHWETPQVTFTVTSLNLVDENRLEVGVRKTETKLYYPQGSAVPDDEICTGTIYSYRDCTYDILYIMVQQEGQWYVADFTVIGGCTNECQH